MTRSASSRGRQNRRKGNEWANEVARRLSAALGRTFRRSLAEAQTGRRNDIREDQASDDTRPPFPLRIEARKGRPSVKKAVRDAEAMREGSPSLLAAAALHFDQEKPGEGAVEILAFPLDDGLIVLSLAAIMLDNLGGSEEDVRGYLARVREAFAWRESRSSTEGLTEKTSRRR